MDFRYKANKTFAQLHKSKAEFKFVRGPVGSGKSSGCVWELFFHACRQPAQEDNVRRSRYAVVRATYPALKSTTVKTWIDWFKDRIKIVYDTPIKGSIKFDLPDGTKLDMEIMFLALETELDIKKLQSLEITGAHINEAKEVDRSIFQMLKTRIDRYPPAKDGGCVEPFILCDYNSPDDTHWLYDLAEVRYPDMPEEDKAKHVFFSQPPAVKRLPNGRYVVNMDADNIDPDGKVGVKPSYYENMCVGNDPDFINVYVMNNYGQVRAGKPVYKDYVDSEHCSAAELRPLAGVPVIIGMDQGLTPSAVFTQMDYNGQIRVFDELVTEDCSLQEFCNDVLWPRIKNKYPEIEGNFTVICDPATNQRSMNDAKAGTDIIKEAGLPYRTAKSNVATLRREGVTNFLRKRGGFLLSPTCKILRKGFISGYKYDEMRISQSTQYKETPAKNEFSHPHDALQYAVLEYYRPRKQKFFKYKEAPLSGSEQDWWLLGKQCLLQLVLTRARKNAQMI